MPDATVPRYYPFMHGEYDVKAGIAALGRDLGNGADDRRVFQIDGQFPVYLAAKRAALSDHARHVLRGGLDERAERAVAWWVGRRLAAEHGGHFALVGGRLSCGLTGQGVELDTDASPLDALALQVQDDLAVLVEDEALGNRLAYLHVAMPSGWPPEEKIGRPFAEVHAPVPHIQSLSAKQDAIARLMVHATRGAVRFAWTVTTDAALNHHPHRRADALAPGPLPDHPAGEPLLRVERQVLWGFPEHHASLFLIRTYLYPFATLDAPTRAALASAVRGMSRASLRYKNMDPGLILDRLASPRC